MEARSGQFINLVIVEDESLYRDMLQRCLAQDPGIRIAGAYGDPHALLADAASLSVDAAILDIELASDLNGFELAMRLRRIHPRLGLVLLSNHREEAFIATLRRRQMTGWAYLLKRSVSDLATLIRAVKGAVEGLIVVDPALVGELEPRPRTVLSTLTQRQRDILGLMAQGYSNQAIAEKLGISVKSVENHVSALLARLEVDSTDPDIHPRVMAVLRYLYETRSRDSY